MKEHLLQLAEGVAIGNRQDFAREYPQAYILRLIHEVGAQSGLAFLGGSALRLLFGLPRFSEDLDFSAVPMDSNSKGVMPPLQLFESLQRELLRSGYDLVWYLTRQPPVEPDLDLLASALTQTQHAVKASEWRQECRDRLRTIEWEKVVSDLRPFVERISDLEQLSPALIEKLLLD